VTATRSRTLGLLAVLGSVFCFAISFGLIKWPGTPGSVIAWWRLVGSSVLWWGVLALQRFRVGRPFPSRHTWVSVLPAALLFGLYISVLFTAVTKTSIAHTEFINSMAPLLTVPIGFYIFRERPNWPALRWGLLSIAGLVIVLFFGPEQGVATVEGDLLMILVLAIAVTWMSTAKWARGRGVDTVDYMAIMMPVALLSATPVALSVAGDEMWPLSGKAWITVVLLSILTGGAAHGLLFFAHRSVPIGTISVVQVSQPALSVFWAWVIVGEAITTVQVPGMALVMVGLALVIWSSQRATPRRAGAPA
jgi:drug/metabolite transporter (DMT)-like permease